jgi:phosphoglycerate dehydrogenase-like enzyme
MASSERPTVGITHEEAAVPKFFTDEDLERLKEVAEVRILGASKEDGFIEKLADIDMLMGAWGMIPLEPAVLAAAPRLKAVCYAAGSIKGFATDAAYDRGITITTAMHANAVPVAEVSVALITLANKNWFTCQDRVRAAGGIPDDGWQLNDLHPGNFRSTVGLIGFGAIGRLVCKRLQAMDLKVLVFDPYAEAAVIEAAGAESVSLLDLASRSSVVSLHAPNIPQTRHMINAEVLGAMADGAVFINTARGALVDEDALVAELQTGRIAAMLDVTYPEPPEAGHPFYTLPNCWLTPHRAGSSAGELRRMGNYAIEDALRIIAGDEPRFPVRREQLATMA